MLSRRALFLALCSLLVAGCATRGGGPSAATSADAASEAPATVPGPVHVVGRIIAVDARALSVMIELGPYTVLPRKVDGRILVSRLDDLRPTARLQASPYVRGRILGARMLAGRPNVGDEVVFLPETF